MGSRAASLGSASQLGFLTQDDFGAAAGLGAPASQISSGAFGQGLGGLGTGLSQSSLGFGFGVGDGLGSTASQCGGDGVLSQGLSQMTDGDLFGVPNMGTQG